MSLEGKFPTAWLTRDLPASDTIGDPRRVDSAIGEAIISHLAARAARLLAKIRTFSFVPREHRS